MSDHTYDPEVPLCIEGPDSNIAACINPVSPGQVTPFTNTANMIPSTLVQQPSTFQLTLDTPVSPTNLSTPEYTHIDQALSRKLGQLAQATDRKSWWGKTSVATRNMAETDNEGSFFTARGTLRTVVNGEEAERSVIVGWMGRVGTLKFAEDGTVTTTTTADVESPLPTRILHIFHPPTPQSPHGALDHIMDLSLSWEAATAIRNQIQNAFWRMVYPSVVGFKGMYRAIQSIPFRTLSQDGQPETPEARERRLYGDETVYTFRMPPQEQQEGVLDLGPTARTSAHKKRSALPQFEVQEVWGIKPGVGYGQQRYGAGWE